MDYGERLAEPVLSRGPRKPLDLELDARREKRRIDQRAESARGLASLSYRAGKVHRADLGVEPLRGIAADRDGETSCIVGAKAQAADDVTPPQGIVRCVEVEVAML
jgi:hypothetical protein